MAGYVKKFLDFIGITDDEDDEDEEYYEEEQVPARRAPRSGLSSRERDRSLEEEEYVPAAAPVKAAPVSQNAARRNASQPARVQASAGAGIPGVGGMKMIVYHPVSYEDTQNIIDNIRNRKPVIVNMEELEIDVAQRILDFISGAVYALDGTMSKISRGIFVVAPANCDVVGSSAEEYEEM